LEVYPNWIVTVFGNAQRDLEKTLGVRLPTSFMESVEPEKTDMPNYGRLKKVNVNVSRNPSNEIKRC